MAITKTVLGSARSSTNSNTLAVTLSRAIAANTPCIAFYVAHASSPPSDASTASGGGVTWTKRGTTQRGNSRTTIFSSDGVASPSGTSITFDDGQSAGAGVGNDAFVIELVGTDDTPSGWQYAANSVTAGSVTVTLGSTPAATSYGLGLAYANDNSTNFSWDTLTEDNESSHTAPTCDTAYASAASPSQSFTATWTGTTFILHGVYVEVKANPITVTPGVASLTTSRFAPTVTASDHQLVTPGVATLSTTGFAPSVAVSDNQTVVPGVASLSLTSFAPVVALRVIPDTASLLTASFAPTVTASNHQIATPDTGSLTLTAFAPDVSFTAHVTATPDTAALSLTGFSPTVPISDEQIVQPGTAALLLDTFAPTVSDHKVVEPGTNALTLTTFAPGLVLTDNQLVTPATASLVLTTFAATVTATGILPPKRTFGGVALMPRRHIRIRPETARLRLTGSRAKVLVSDHLSVVPKTARLRLATQAPSIELFDQDLADVMELLSVGLI